MDVPTDTSAQTQTTHHFSPSTQLHLRYSTRNDAATIRTLWLRVRPNGVFGVRVCGLEFRVAGFGFRA